MDQIISLPIFYDLDSSRIRPDAARILDTFAQEVMIRYPRLIAELGSHTDCRASVDYNTRLAQRRADSARNYLMRRWNIDSSRIIAVGFGEKELINDCKCEGAEKVGFTPYIAGKTRKMVITKDKKGNVIGSIGIHLDITEAKNNRELLEEQKMELDTIFSNVPMGIILGKNDKFIRTNS